MTEHRRAQGKLNNEASTILTALNGAQVNINRAQASLTEAQRLFNNIYQRQRRAIAVGASDPDDWELQA